MAFLYLYSNVKLRYSPSNTSVAFTIGFMNVNSFHIPAIIANVSISEITKST
jgi:hypothetical protein